MIQIKMSPEQFAGRLKEVEAELNETLSPTTATFTHSGVKLAYTYDGTELTIQVLSKPFFIDAAYVEGKISAWFAGT